MNIEEALTAAKNTLARKEELAKRWPTLCTLKADVRQWRYRVEELTTQYEEEQHEK